MSAVRSRLAESLLGLEVGYTRSGDLATHQLSIDGDDVGARFVAYAPHVEVAEVSYADHLRLRAVD